MIEDMTSLGTLTDTRTTAGARARAWTITATAALGWAVVTLAVLHLVSSFNPVVDPLSRYAFTDNGSGLLEAGLVSLAVGVLALVGALHATRLALPRTTVLGGATSLGLLTAALFPATYSIDIDPASGHIHQYASLVAFLSLPGIGFALLDRLRDVPGLDATRILLKRVLQVSAAALVLFGAAYVAGKLPASPVSTALMQVLPVGLTQRIVLVADLALLVAMLVIVSRFTRRTQAHDA